MHDALETAMLAARAGGRVVRERAGAVGEVRSKSTAIDLVTASDIAAGVDAVRAILSVDPEANFVVEEDEVYGITGARRGMPNDDSVWIIDPIDGTTSFLHGYPCYSVSVAYLEHGIPRAGAVYNAALDEMNYATEGGGSFRDGARLSARVNDALGSAVLVTGFPYDRTEPLERQLLVLSAFLRLPVQDIRRDGSAAVDLCHVAAGRCDGFWEYGLRVWDMAAGVLICREAGATVTDVDGQPWTTDSTSICAANPALHRAMLDVIASSTQGFGV